MTVTVTDDGAISHFNRRPCPRIIRPAPRSPLPRDCPRSVDGKLRALFKHLLKGRLSCQVLMKKWGSLFSYNSENGLIYSPSTFETFAVMEASCTSQRRHVRNVSV